MRATLVAAASLLVFALLMPQAAAEETFNCHSWEIFVGDRGQGAGVSTEDGATYLAAAGVYVVNDGAPVVNPWLFSIWFYTENNGQPGLQRGDEVCDDTAGGSMGEQDCFISCTF